MKAIYEKMLTVTLILSLGIASCASSTENTVVVETKFGKLRGKEVTAINNQKYLSFTGIPYAKPPVGDLRFAKPEPHPPLGGEFDATRGTVHCLQPGENIFVEELPEGQEDCLVLNVFVKNLEAVFEEVEDTTTASSTSQRPVTTSATEKKKVVVWIHGGGFIVGGAADYPAGTFVTTQDVILVSINYRLGIFGFLSTEDEAASGNYGLWDQLLAIRWVKDNIASFGGDSEDITIAGESAGGASVAMLSITPTAKDLFSKVFPMSGTATSGFALSRDARKVTLQLAQTTSCKSENTEDEMSAQESRDLINCLRTISSEDLKNFFPFTLEKAQFTPRVDGEFFPLEPSILLKDDSYLERIGFFNRKYLFGVDNNEQAIMDGSYDATVGYFMSLENKTEEEKATIVSEFVSRTESFYFGTRFLMNSPPKDLAKKITSWYNCRISGQSLTEMVTDMNFLIPTYDYLYTIARSRSAESYLFYFNHYPAYMKGKFRGIGHGVDLLYMFDLKLEAAEALLRYGIEGEFDDDDRQLKVAVSDMVGQFVRTGNPWNGLKEELSGGWPVFDLQGNHYLDLSLKPTIRRHLQREKRDFWLSTVPGWVAKYNNEGP